ncbi:unnamed protein product [Amaranthus hypochondriacus]
MIALVANANIGACDVLRIAVQLRRLLAPDLINVLQMVSFGLEDFAKRYGTLTPSQFVDVVALVGDKSDNIPGVTGIGEVNAVQLITEFGSLEELLSNVDKV